MTNYNLFITFEGGEGTGKSTASKLLKEKLQEKGIEVFLTREPGGNDLPFAEEIRKVIMNHGEIDPITELLLFEASRREHITKKIEPALKEGKLVISDRFEDSTIVYQGMVKNVNIESIKQANQISRGDISPSLVFIFDLDPVVGQERINSVARNTNRFDHEGMEFHNKIRQAYLDLAKQDTNKYTIIDASLSIEEIVDSIISKIEEYGN